MANTTHIRLYSVEETHVINNIDNDTTTKIALKHKLNKACPRRAVMSNFLCTSRAIGSSGTDSSKSNSSRNQSDILFTNENVRTVTCVHNETVRTGTWTIIRGVLFSCCVLSLWCNFPCPGERCGLSHSSPHWKTNTQGGLRCITIYPHEIRRDPVRPFQLGQSIHFY